MPVKRKKKERNKRKATSEKNIRLTKNNNLMMSFTDRSADMTPVSLFALKRGFTPSFKFNESAYSSRY